MFPMLLFSAARAACPTFAEPSDDWADPTPAVLAAASDARAALEHYAFPAQMDEKGRTGVRTDGLLIVRDGEILYERYGRDWTAAQPHLQWSVTKAFAATMVGMAVLDGSLDVDASICDSIDVPNPDACAITTRNLMEHGSGLAWRETYEGSPPTASSIVGMLYGGGKEDMASFVAGHALRDVPGTTYSYSSGDTMVQTAVAHTHLQKNSGDDYLNTRLFGPLGIQSAEYEVDGSNVPIGASSLYLTPRDMARFGAFLLQDGCWGGQRLLPEGWVARATTPASTIDGKHVGKLTGALPGWDLWLNRTHPRVNEGNVPWPAAPESTFAAFGHWRQSIFVLPEHGIVIARTADDRDGTFQRNTFLSLVIAYVEALPARKPMAAAPVATEAAVATPADPAPASGDARAETDDAETNADAETGAAGETDGAAETEAAGEAEAVADPNSRGFTPAAFPPPPLRALVPTDSTPPDKYDVGLLSIGTSFAALHGCACRYISKRSKEACVDYIRIQPDIARARFDDETQTVTARAFGMAKTKARPGPDGSGCRLVD